MSVDRAARNFGAPGEHAHETLRRAKGKHGEFEVTVEMSRLTGKHLAFMNEMKRTGIPTRLKSYWVYVFLYRAGKMSDDHATFDLEKDAHERFEALLKEYGLKEEELK